MRELNRSIFGHGSQVEETKRAEVGKIKLKWWIVGHSKQTAAINHSTGHSLIEIPLGVQLDTGEEKCTSRTVTE